MTARTTLLACLLALAAGSAAALDVRTLADAEPLSTPASELLALAASLEPGEPDDAVVLLIEQARADFDEQGSRTWQWHFVSQIRDEDGIDYIESVRSPWEPWHQERPVLRGRVVTAEGVEHRVGEEDVLESPAASSAADVHVDRRILSAVLPQLGVGAVIELHVTLRDERPAFRAGTSGAFYFGAPYATAFERIVLTAPKRLPLRHEALLLPDLEPTERTRAGRRTVVYELSPSPASPAQRTRLPPDVPRLPCVRWSTGESWAAVAAAYSELVDGRIDPAAARALAAEVIEEGAPARVAAQQALDWVASRVRYTGLELGEAALVPVSPQTVLERGYGDCKDQSTLLVALLRAAGHPASVALLRAGWGEDVRPELPGVGSFNHAIVFVDGAEPFWIDPTAPEVPAGELPGASRHRLALVAAPGTKALRLTPQADPDVDRYEELIEARVADLGAGAVTEHTLTWGRARRSLGKSWAEADHDTLAEQMRSYAATAYKSTELDEVSAELPDDRSEPGRLTFRVPETPRVFTEIGELFFATTFWPTLEDLEGESRWQPSDEEELATIPAAHRQADYWLPQPLSRSRRYVLDGVPSTWKRSGGPEELEERFGPVQVSRRRSTDEQGRLVLQQDLRIEEHRITAGEFARLAEWLAGQREEAEKALHLTRFEHEAFQKARGPELPEAIAALRAEAEARPESAGALLRHSLALSTAGLMHRAVELAERATELAPERPQTWRVLAALRARDELGRLLPGRELDPEGALAAAERALELDADHEFARNVRLQVLSRPAEEGGLPPMERRLALIEALRDDTRHLEESGSGAGPEQLSRQVSAALMLCEPEALEEELRRAAGTPVASVVAAALALDSGDAAGAQAELDRLESREEEGAAMIGFLISGMSCGKPARFERALAWVEVQVGEPLPGTTGVRWGLGPESCRQRVEAIGVPNGLPLRVLAASMTEDESEVRRLLAAEDRDDAEALERILGSMGDDFAGGLGSDDLFLEPWMPPEQLVWLGCDAAQASTGVDLGWVRTVRLTVLEEEPPEAIFVVDEGEEGWRLASARTVAQRLARRALAAQDPSEQLEQARRLFPVQLRSFEREGEGAEHERLVRLARLGLRLGAAGQHEAAVLLFEPLTEAWPEDRELLDLASSSALLSNRPEQALEWRREMAGKVDGFDRLLHAARAAIEAEHPALLDELQERWKAGSELSGVELTTLGDLLGLDGRLEESLRAYEDALAAAETPDTVHNQIAWTRLVLDKVDDETERRARLGAEQSVGSAGLHTLATVRAARGRVDKALESLRGTLDARADPELLSYDRFVLGLIAENVGETAEARRCYEEALAASKAEEEPDTPLATARLVRARLEELGSE